MAYSTEYHKTLLSRVAEDGARNGGALPKGLEFLRPFPEFHGFRFGQDETAIRAIAIRQSLKITGNVADGFAVTRKDGERLQLSMRDGKCSGIQRLRKE